jgi:general secretion pathway protein D
LFRAENKTRTKTNLMVFLRPVIVRDGKTSEAISLNRYDYLRGMQGGYQSDNRVEKDDNVPMLPPVPNSPNRGGGAPADNMLDWGRMERPIPPPNGSNGSDRGAPGTPGGPSNPGNNSSTPGNPGISGNPGNVAPNGHVDSAVNGYAVPSDGNAPSGMPSASPSVPANPGAGDGFATPGVRP